MSTHRMGSNHRIRKATAKDRRALASVLDMRADQVTDENVADLRRQALMLLAPATAQAAS